MLLLLVLTQLLDLSCAQPGSDKGVDPLKQLPGVVPGLRHSGSFGFYDGLDYTDNTLRTVSTADEKACMLSCKDGCDFVTYTASTRECRHKYTDKSTGYQSYMSGQLSGFLFGEIRCNTKDNRDRSCIIAEVSVIGVGNCKRACLLHPQCRYTTWQRFPNNLYTCSLRSFRSTPGTVLGFRLNHDPLNAKPNVRGRFDVIGSSGVVAIHSNLLPDGKVLFTARPEYQRGGPNLEMVARPQVPYGEIASVFDPTNGKVVPSFVDDNVFCHGAILTANGRIFMTGGDVGGGMGSPAQGLAIGLNKQRFFEYQSNTWRYDNDMLKTRWYPSPVRTTNGNVFIIGGATNGTSGIPEMTMEMYREGSAQNVLIRSPFLERTRAAYYPITALIPGSGNIFMFGVSSWVILDQNNGAEIEQASENVQGIRQGGYPAGTVLLGLRPENGYRGVLAMFGGTNNPREEVALDTVAKLTLTGKGPRRWRYDEGKMPYGRVVSDAILQPNGKVLLFNGAQLGQTGGSVGGPLLKASALECFVYDPDAPDGQRFQVLNASPIQRLYHSSALLLPDGRTMVAGTDQATFNPRTAYEHRVEAFTPPWLLNGTPRPTIKSVPSGSISYGSTFQVTFEGKVTGVSMITPGASTHGVDFTQRLVFLAIENRNGNTLTLKAPPNATIALQGHHMLFLLNGDTPSKAKFIHLQ